MPPGGPDGPRTPMWADAFCWEDAMASYAGDAGDDRPTENREPELPRQVVVLAKPEKEARSLLTGVQYWATVGYVKRLIDFGDRQATADLEIRQIGDFWELRLKGCGFLRKV